MHEFERMALRRGADGDVAARCAFRRLGERKSGFELEAFVIRRGKDCYRQTVGLEALLIDEASERLESLGDCLECGVPVPVPFT